MTNPLLSSYHLHAMFSKSLSPDLIPPLPHISISNGLWSFPPGWLYHRHFKLIIFKIAILLPLKACFYLTLPISVGHHGPGPPRRPLLTSLAPHFKTLIHSYPLCFINIPPSKLLLQIIIPFLEYCNTFLITLSPSSPMSLPIHPSHWCQRNFSKMYI